MNSVDRKCSSYGLNCKKSAIEVSRNRDMGRSASPSELATALASNDCMPRKFEFAARAQRPRPAVAESSSHYQKIGKTNKALSVPQMYITQPEIRDSKNASARNTVEGALKETRHEGLVAPAHDTSSIRMRAPASPTRFPWRQ